MYCVLQSYYDWHCCAAASLFSWGSDFDINLARSTLSLHAPARSAHGSACAGGLKTHSSLKGHATGCDGCVCLDTACVFANDAGKCLQCVCFVPVCGLPMLQPMRQLVVGLPAVIGLWCCGLWAKQYCSQCTVTLTFLGLVALRLGISLLDRALTRAIEVTAQHSIQRRAGFRHDAIPAESGIVAQSLRHVC